MNHFKDEEEEWEKYKMLCRFLNPQAASELFDKKDVQKTETTPDMFGQMSKDLKGRYTAEELAAFMEDPAHFANLDVIKKD